MIQIFNVQLNGDDAKKFCSNPNKMEWIKKHTNQQNEDIINEFLSKPLIDGDCGCGCGGAKTVNNVTNRIPKEVANDSEPIKTPKFGKRGNGKRGNGNKDA